MNQRINLIFSLDYDTETYRPGCAGCDPNSNDYGSDYCRCTKIESVTVKDIDHLRLTETLIEKMKKGNGNKLFREKYDSIIYCLDRIIKKMDINSSSFECAWSHGYYGEEVDSIYLDVEIESEIREHFNKLAYSGMTLTEKINYALEYEYGYLLEKLKNVKWKIENIPVSDIVVPQNEYYHKKLNKEFTEYYKDWQLPICVIDKENRIIDGFHRFFANKDKEEIKVIKAK